MQHNLNSNLGEGQPMLTEGPSIYIRDTPLFICSSERVGILVVFLYTEISLNKLGSGME